MRHLGDGVNEHCRPCSFERPPARTCTKAWFCDFCHLHGNDRRLRRKGITAQRAQAQQAQQERDRKREAEAVDLSKLFLPPGLDVPPGLGKQDHSGGISTATTTMHSVETLPDFSGVYGRNGGSFSVESLPSVRIPGLGNWAAPVPPMPSAPAWSTDSLPSWATMSPRNAAGVMASTDSLPSVQFGSMESLAHLCTKTDQRFPSMENLAHLVAKPEQRFPSMENLAHLVAKQEHRALALDSLTWPLAEPAPLTTFNLPEGAIVAARFSL